jgi:hypothetical protein
VVVFVVGAASLGTEIATARLLAPYFGASTFVWANTIATVLLALSVGYWLGGRIADRDPSLHGLCRLVLAAGLLLAVIPFIARPFLDRAVRRSTRSRPGRRSVRCWPSLCWWPHRSCCSAQSRRMRFV